jgi:hypothetical protein
MDRPLDPFTRDLPYDDEEDYAPYRSTVDCGDSGEEFPVSLGEDPNIKLTVLDNLYHSFLLPKGCALPNIPINLRLLVREFQKLLDVLKFTTTDFVGDPTSVVHKVEMELGVDWSFPVRQKTGVKEWNIEHLTVPGDNHVVRFDFIPQGNREFLVRIRVEAIATPAI